MVWLDDSPVCRDPSRRRFLQMSAIGAVAAGAWSIPHVVFAANGKTILKARSFADINELDPGFYQNQYNVNVMNCIYTKLISYVPGRRWKTQLEAAEFIKQVDPTHIDFKLKKGLQFSGGFGEITAEDVKYSFERIIKLGSPIKGDWVALDHVEVKDKYNGTIVLKEPFAPLWNITLPYGAGCIVSKKAVEAAGGKDFGMKPPCFSGPYILQSWKPKQVTILARNPAWKGPRADFDEIHIYPINDAKSAEISYQSGDIDFTAIDINDYAHLKKNPPNGTTVMKYPSLDYIWLGMNKSNPSLADINMRRAIQYAVNIPQILAAAYDGQVAPATGLIAPGLVGHREHALISPKGNLQKAKAFLAKAGGAPAEPLRLYVWSDATWTTMAQVIQAQLGQIGLNIQLEVLDSGSWSTLGIESQGSRWKKTQLMLNRYSMQPDPYYATEWFTSKQVGIWNWEHFSNKRFDKLNEEGIRTTDHAKRNKIYVEMQNIMERSGCYRFITHGASPLMYRSADFEDAVRPDGEPLYRLFKPKT